MYQGGFERSPYIKGRSLADLEETVMLQTKSQSPVNTGPQPERPSPVPPNLPAVGLSGQVRLVLGVIAVAVIGLGCFLAVWQVLNPGHGVSGAGAGLGTAAVFTAGLLAAVGSISGALPASIKVGDVQLQIQAAQQRTAEAAANLVAAKDPQKSISELPILKKNPALLEPFQQINRARQTPPDQWEREIDAGQVPVYPDFVS
jgi:hypothetical protein